MKKITGKWKNLSVFFRVFLLIALLFLAVGLGTVGSVQSTGNSFVLQSKQASDTEEPCVVFELHLPEGIESASNIAVREVYLNIGAIYSDVSVAKLSLKKSGSASSKYYSTVYVENGKSTGDSELSIANRFAAEQDTGEYTVRNAEFNWVKAPFRLDASSSFTLNSYSFYSLTAKNCNILINEIVFIGERLDNKEPTGEFYPL